MYLKYRNIIICVCLYSFKLQILKIPKKKTQNTIFLDVAVLYSFSYCLFSLILKLKCSLKKKPNY